METYFEFEVRLSEVTPPVWRRFLLKKTATFQDLHDAIQAASEWEDCHLYAFYASRRTRDEPIAGASGYELSESVTDEAQVPLADYFNQKVKKCLYNYDFGDDWMCDVTLRKIVSDPATFQRKLLGGERAFPLEDSGGIDGYLRAVELATAGADPDDDSGEFEEWMEDWDPELFDFEAVRKRFDC